MHNTTTTKPTKNQQTNIYKNVKKENVEQLSANTLSRA
jgi:hypothetical protein